MFNYQGSLSSLFETAYLDYHIFRCLSTTFLILFFALSLQVHSLDVLFATAKIEYHVFHLLSTTFLMFSSLIFFRCIVLHQTEKEGFEPSRRDYRPTPLAGAPLQPLEYFSWSSFLSIFTSRQAWRIGYYTWWISICQPVFYVFVTELCMILFLHFIYWKNGLLSTFISL